MATEDLGLFLTRGLKVKEVRQEMTGVVERRSGQGVKITTVQKGAGGGQTKLAHVCACVHTETQVHAQKRRNKPACTCAGRSILSARVATRARASMILHRYQKFHSQGDL